MKTVIVSIFCSLALVASGNPSHAEEPASNRGYTDVVPASPKEPWSDFKPIQDNEGTPWWGHALLWIPNRILDIIDIFRVDVGVGPAVGGVIRVTEYGQLGFRQMMPASLRVGDFGREFPVVVEASNEFGVGPAFKQSKDREVCPGEVGLGADALIVGAYGGVCIDEALDFVAGIFFLDPKGDDL